MFADDLPITDAVLDDCCTSPTRNRSLQIGVSNALPFRSRASVYPEVVSFVGVGAYFQPHQAALNVHSL